MDELPGWVAQLLGPLGGFGVAGWLIWRQSNKAEARIARMETEHKAELDKRDGQIAVLNEKLVGAYRETLPALTQSARAVEAIADVLPTIAAAEPARITGGRSR